MGILYSLDILGVTLCVLISGVNSEGEELKQECQVGLDIDHLWREQKMAPALEGRYFSLLASVRSGIDL